MRRAMVVSFLAVLVLGAARSNAAFEPMFRVADIRGEVHVGASGGDPFKAAEQDKAYPYGAAVKTGGKGAGSLLLSAGSTVRLAANTACVPTEGVTDPSVKLLRLDRGKIDVTLEQGFETANGFRVPTSVAVCEVLSGGRFRIGARAEKDMDVATFEVETGSVRVSGPNFDVPSVGDGGGLTISTASDRSYTVLETTAGEFAIEIKDAAGDPRRLDTRQGSIVKIWRRTDETGKMLIVTILITAADGSTEEAITYTEEIPETPPEDEGREQPGPDDGTPADTTTTTTTLPGDLRLLTDIPTTTTTTTTTQPGDVPTPAATIPPVASRPRPSRPDDDDDDDDGGSTTTTTTIPSPTPTGRR